MIQIMASPDGQFEVRSKFETVRFAADRSIGSYPLPGPGEYEVGGVMAEATAATTRLELEDLTLGVLHPPGGTLTDAELEQLGAVDLLFVPLGEAGLAAKPAIDLVGQIDARLVIPMAPTAEPLAAFLKGVGTHDRASSPAKVTRAQLPTEGTRVCVIEPKGQG